MTRVFCCILLTVLSAAVMIFPSKTQAESAKRIISLAPHITELLFEIGAGANVVGVSDYSDFPAQAKVLPKVAGYASINIEAVLELKPDLVIAWRSGNPASDIERLQQLGINVVFSDPKQISDIAAELRQLGQLTGYQHQAEQAAARFESRLQQLKREFASKKAITVFYAMSTEPLSTVANDAWAQQIIAVCGAKNPFAQAKGSYPQVGIEQVLLAAPQVIIQASSGGQTADFSYWQQFTYLMAVQKQQFLTVDADYMYRATPRTLLGIAQLCQGVDRYR